MKRLARVEPDFVIATGDFIGDGHSNAETVDAVTAIHPREASLYVLGSNDYYGPKPKNPLRYLSKNKKRRVFGKPNPWRDLVEGLDARAGV